MNPHGQNTTTPSRPSNGESREERTVIALEQRMAQIQFSQNTTNRPNINLFGIALPREDNLRRTIPSSGHVLSQIITLLLHSGQTKIRQLHKSVSRARKQAKGEAGDGNYLDSTIFVAKNVAWFDVAVKHIGRMNVFDRAQHLVNKILNVLIG